MHYFGIGNETWGCGGNMRPEYYADLYRQYATYVKAPRGKRPKIVASGGNDEGTRWIEVLRPRCSATWTRSRITTTPSRRGVWDKKGNCARLSRERVDFDAEATRCRSTSIITKNVAILDKNDPQNKVAFYVDEWGTWYDPEPGREPGFLWQQNTLRDALVAASTSTSSMPRQARADDQHRADGQRAAGHDPHRGPKMALTPTYHVFQMYIPFQGATFLPTEIQSPQYTLGSDSVPAVTVTAARDTAGKLQLGLVNLDPKREAVVTADVTGAQAKGASGRVLTAKAMDAHNTVDAPEAVKPAAFSARRSGGKLVLRLPPKSVAVVALEQ